jgi:protein involved in polysaccharide export with SLBB domain
MAIVAGVLAPVAALFPVAAYAQSVPDLDEPRAAPRRGGIETGDGVEPGPPPPAVAAPSVPLEEPVDPATYVCGRGDVFELHFWGRQNFTLRVPVGLAGRMFIWKVGYVEVAGKTLADAREAIRKSVLRFYPGLNFDAQLVTPRTFLVHVVENVVKPGIYPARATDRLSAVLGRAGGIKKALVKQRIGESPTADVGESTITTGGNGSQRRIEIKRRDGKVIVADLLSYTLSGDKSQNPYMLDGDVIRVPFEQLSVTISGPVNRPGRYELIKTKDLPELVALAGGLKSSVTPRLPIRIVRRDYAERDHHVEVAHGGARAPIPVVPLKDDDRVIVPSAEELQRGLFLVGALVGGKQADEATSVKRMAFEEGDSVRTLIERAGGVGPSADLQGAYILRGEGDRAKPIPVDLEALLVKRDLSADRKLEMGDTVMVPYKRRGVFVEGSVMRPGVYQYNPRLSIREYVQNAGGASKMARSETAIRVVTPTGETKQYSDKPVIKPGDTIVVPERTFSRSEVVGLIITGVSLAISTFALVLTARK